MACSMVFRHCVPQFHNLCVSLASAAAITFRIVSQWLSISNKETTHLRKVLLETRETCTINNWSAKTAFGDMPYAENKFSSTLLDSKVRKLSWKLPVVTLSRHKSQRRKRADDSQIFKRPTKYHFGAARRLRLSYGKISNSSEAWLLTDEQKQFLVAKNKNVVPHPLDSPD